MKLKAGKYWIGDPCYVLGEGQFGFDWDKFCSACFKDDPTGRLNEGVVDHQGIRFAHFGTAYGDGCYGDQFGNSYGVDAGCLACIPAAFVRDEDAGLGTFHQFDNDFDCEYDEGKIIFGHVEIDTDPEPDEDEDEYDDEYRRDDDDDEDDNHEQEED